MENVNIYIVNKILELRFHHIAMWLLFYKMDNFYIYFMNCIHYYFTKWISKLHVAKLVVSSENIHCVIIKKKYLKKMYYCDRSY